MVNESAGQQLPPHPGPSKRIFLGDIDGDMGGEQIDDGRTTKRFSKGHAVDGLQDEDRDIQQNNSADG